MKKLEYDKEFVVPNETPYPIYQEHINRYFFASNFTRNKIVLDVACGTGYGSDYLIERGAKKVIGGDISTEALMYARQSYKRENLDFIQLDAAKLPFANDYFDAIVSFETIEHLKDYKAFLSECKRVLKKDGMFICSTPNKKLFSHNQENPFFPYHFKEFYPKEFFKLVSKYFAHVKQYGQNYIHIKSIIQSKLYHAKDSIPGGGKIWNSIKNILHISKPFFQTLQNSAKETNKEFVIDKKYQVLPYRSNLLVSPLYVIVTAINKKEY